MGVSQRCPGVVKNQAVMNWLPLLFHSEHQTGLALAGHIGRTFCARLKLDCGAATTYLQIARSLYAF